jgi:hypothetical protein
MIIKFQDFKLNKIISILLLMFVLIISSCGPSASEREMMTTYDSTAYVDSTQKVLLDSVGAPAPVEERIFTQQPLTTPETPASQIESVEKKIGEITHLIKDTMNYGVTDTVEVTISYNCPKVIIQNEVATFRSHALSITSQPVKITPEMRARLIDPTGNSFRIVPITDTVQMVEMTDSTYTLWQWMVTPIKAGDQSLVLSVDMIVDNNKKSLKIYQDKIFVHIGFWSKVWNFIQINWTYITYVVGGLLAILAFLYKEKIIKIFKS